jgi:hypothetical protein
VEARDTELGDLIISEHADLRWLVSTAILDSTPADTPKSASRERNQVVRPYFVLKPVPMLILPPERSLVREQVHDGLDCFG